MKRTWTFLCVVAVATASLGSVAVADATEAAPLAPQIRVEVPSPLSVTLFRDQSTVIDPGFTIYNDGDAGSPLDFNIQVVKPFKGGMLPRVAVCCAEGYTNGWDTQNKLAGTGQFSAVDTINLLSGAPSLAQLQQYDAVLVYSYDSYPDPAALGDVMADYADSGGGVLCMGGEIGLGYEGGSMTGRWETAGYVMMDRSDYTEGQAYLGTVYDYGHPIMAGVSSFDGGAYSYRSMTYDLYPGVTRIADWSDGRPLVAAATLNGVRRADVVFLPISDAVDPGLWNSATDGALLMANALTWVASSPLEWLSVAPVSGTIPGGGSVSNAVTFDAAGLSVGAYAATLAIYSNDPYQPVVSVPCDLTVAPDPLSVTPEEDLLFNGVPGGPFSPATSTLTLTNTGATPLDWSAATTQTWALFAPASGTLNPGESASVSVSIGPDANTFPQGDYADTLTVTNVTSGALQARPIRLAVMYSASLPFFDGFESGTLAPYWQVSGTNEYRTTVASIYPYAGMYHLLMDDYIDGNYASRNECTLVVDLSTHSNVTLSFRADGPNDEPNGPPPVPFTGGADFDGVAISDDGNTWYHVTPLWYQYGYQQTTVNISDYVATYGLSPSKTFRIRFNQYDDFAYPTDGILIDDVSITGEVIDPMQVYPSDLAWFSGTQGGPFSGGMTYSVVNEGDVPLDWTAAPTQPWLEAVPASGTLAVGESAPVEVRLTADAALLPRGSYWGAVNFSNTATGATRTRQAYIDVYGSLAVTPWTEFRTAGPEGGPFTPSSKTYTLQNSSATLSVDWQAYLPDGGSWFDLAPLNGVLPPGGTVDVVATLNATAATMPPGDYGAGLVITNITAAEDFYRSARLQVVAPPPNGFAWEPLFEDPGWSTSGEWQFGVPAGQGGYYTGYPDPYSGATGVNVYGVNLNGDYATPGDGAFHYLTAGPFDCRLRSGVALQFQRWLNTQYMYEAVASVEVSNDGANWTEVWANYEGWITDWTWTPVSYDISAVADNQPAVYVRWGYAVSSSAYPCSGWNIDDIALTGAQLDPLQVTPADSLQSSGHPGGPFTPAGQAYTLANIGDQPLDWTAAAGQTWVLVSPGGGTLLPGESATVQVDIGPDAAMLAPGIYADNVTFTDGLTGATETRAVGLEVYVSPDVWVNPLAVSATVYEGGTATQAIEIGNAGDAALQFTLKTRETARYLAGTAAAAMPAAIDATGDGLSLTYAIAAPTASRVGNYDRLTIDGLESYERDGAPIVPVLPVAVLVPYGKKVASVDVAPVGVTDLPQTYALAPGQQPQPISQASAAVQTPPDPALYAQATPWPGMDHEAVGLQDKRGYQIYRLNLFPVQYTPATGAVAVAQEMTVRVTFANEAPASVPRPTPALAQELLATVANGAALASYAEAAQAGADTAGGPAADLAGGPYEYVIITSAALEAAPGPYNFQALRDARSADGHSATIVTTEWIYANYDSTRPDGNFDNQTQIRNFLIDAYNTWGTQYALIGGANGVVPARHFWVDSYSGAVDFMPVDMYYGCTSPATCTFDFNANGYYGEPWDGPDGGDVDLMAEIYVGRAPVENADEVANFVRKTLDYNATQDPYLPLISMLGEHLGFGGISEYAEASMEQIRLGSSADGYSTVGFENHTRPDMFDFDTSVNLYDNPYYSWGGWELLSLMNGGMHVFNHLGHSNQTYCAKLNTYDLPYLYNNKYFFMYSQGCEPGWFDSPDCFAEVLTTVPSGAFAAIMNARFGWGRFDSTDGPSQRFDRQYWDAAFAEGLLELGRANQDSKEDNLWDINGSCIRWCYYELNLFGDPIQEMRLVEACEWLDVNPDAGTVDVGAPAAPVDVTFLGGTLAPGTYEGDIIVNSNDRNEPQLLVPATLTVLPDPLAYAPQEGFTASGAQDGPFAPAYKDYTLTNNGATALSWTAAYGAPWLDVAPMGGSLGAGEAAPLTLAIGAAAATLPPGVYTDTVVLTNASTGHQETIAVELTVTNALNVQPESDFAASGPEGGPFAPESITYLLTNVGSNPVEWQAATSAGWLDLSATGGTLMPGEPVFVTATVNASANLLPFGTYSDVLYFPDVTHGIMATRNVTLTIAPPPPVSFYQESLDVDPGWTREGQWEFGVPQGQCGDPPAAWTGANVFGYNLAGCYPDGLQPVSLTAGPIDCTGFTNVRLKFMRWLGIESASFDHATVQVSTDGYNWATVWNHDGGSFQDWEWVPCEYDISAVANNQPTVYLRWIMGPMDGSVVYSGWNIDDVELIGNITDGLRVSPATGLASSGPEGGPFTPAGVTYTVNNGGGVPLNWTATATQPWVVVAPSAGTLNPGETISVDVALDAALLPIGNYSDTVTFTNTLSGYATARPVSLRVFPIPGEIAVTDTVPPETDLAVPFGALPVGQQRLEQVTIANADPAHDLIVTRVGSGGLYTEDFEDGLAQDWVEIADADWQVLSGEYRALHAGTDNWVQSMYTHNAWTDAAYEVTIRRAGEPGYIAATLFRASDDFNMAAGTGTAYGVGITGYGEYWVIKFINGQAYWLQQWSYSPYINTGDASNIVLVNFVGDTIQVWFNLQLAWSGTDSEPLTAGRIALSPYLNNYLTIYYDNVNVWQPLPVSGGVSAEQQWYNDHPLEGGSLEAAPAGAVPLPYTGARDESPATGVRLSGSAFQIQNVPPVPFAVAPGSSVTFDVLYAPQQEAFDQYALIIESNDMDEPELEVQLTGDAYVPVHIAHTPLTTTTDLGPYTVQAEATARFGVAQATLFWSNDGGATFTAVPMADLGANQYAAEIPAQFIGAYVYYYLEFTDANGDVNRAPETAPGMPYGFEVQGIPNLVVAPGNLDYVLPPETSEARSVTLENTGTWPVAWQVVETSPALGAETLAAAAQGRQPSVDWSAPQVADTLLVGFKQRPNAAANASIHAAANARLVRRFQIAPVDVVRLPKGANPAAVAAIYKRFPDVAFVEPNYLLKVDTEPNDPEYPQLWGLNNYGQTGGVTDADIDAPEAWNSGTGSHDVLVGVIDTGVDYTHPDLQGNLWTNDAELNGAPGYDDDANGIVDDIYGARWNDGTGVPTSGDPFDGHSHGTHVSGTIGGVGNNGTGVAGVNWNVRIMGLKFLNDGGSGATADAIAALEYAIAKGVDVTNNSWGGGGYSDALRTAILNAGAAGQLFIAAAGNSSSNNDVSPHYPSSYDCPNIVAVASSDSYDNVSWFSCYGATSVDLAAPGSSILSTVPGGYGYMDGTSMATPHVTGVAALLLSHTPTATPDTVKAWLLDSVDVLPQWAGLTVTGGRLNAANAVALAGAPWLSESAESGVLAPGESTTILVTASTAGLADGFTDTVNLSFLGDPDGPVQVPVTLTVLEPIPIVHTPLGDTTGPGPYSVDAEVTAGAGLVRLDLFWTTDGGATFTSTPFVNTGGSAYTAQIPEQPLGTSICYYIEAEDATGYVRRDPRGAPGDLYCFQYRGIPALTVSPAELAFVQAPDVVASQDLLLSNVGTWPTAWALSESGGVYGAALQIPLPAIPAILPNPAVAGLLPLTQPSPAQPAHTLDIPAGYPVLAGEANVLLLLHDDLVNAQQLLNGLQAFPDIGSVGVLDARAAAPTLADLAPWDVVIVTGTVDMYDPVATGNALADYVDAGGSVVETVGPITTGGNWELGGRFVTDGYEPFTHGTLDFVGRNLGWYDPAHPIMAGVSYLSDPIASTIALRSGAQAVADWNDGIPLVATQGTGCVGINTLPLDYGYISGDYVLLFHNAIVWLAQDWLSEAPTSGVLQPGESVLISVVADSTGIEDGFTGTKTLTVFSDDPAGPQTVPVTLTVQTAAPPVAEFAALPTAGCAPLDVQFTDASLNGPTQWWWDFGDGSVSDQQNPSHTYAAAGTYSVTLTVWNLVGSHWVTKTDLIAVHGAPDAPSGPNPADGATEVPLETTLSWAAGPAGFAVPQVAPSAGADRLAGALLLPDAESLFALDAQAIQEGINGLLGLQSAENNVAPTQTATVAIGEAEGQPGQSVVVPVTLVAEGTRPCSMNFDVLFDPLKVQVVGATTGPAAAAAGKEAMPNLIAPNQLQVLVAGMNNNAISDGVLLYLELQVLPPALPGERLPLQGANLTIVDPDAFEVPGVMADGGINVTLSCVTTYDVYFGTDPAPSAPLFVNLTVPYCPVGGLVHGTTYYWQVVAKDCCGTTPGPVWSFTALAGVNAGFTAIPTSGFAPLAVQFTDTSTGGPTSWQWDFGDGSGSTEPNPAHMYTTPGLYSVSLTVQNDAGTDTETKTDFITVLTPDMAASRSFWYSRYSSPGTVDVTLTIENSGSPLSALGIVESIPDGWAFDSVVSTNPPSIVPPPGATGTLEFAWITMPAFPVQLTYRLVVPAGETGDKAFAGQVLYRRSGPEYRVNVGPEWIISPRVYHSLDYNPADYVISLSELLRLIQFYNLAEYHCEPGTEDGYAPGPGSHDGAAHDSDYNPQDWSVNLSELLRAIQFYNMGGYHPEDGTEDGFAPGLGPLRATKSMPPAPLSLSRTLDGQSGYQPQGTLDIEVEIAGGAGLTALGLEETLPEGWTFNSLLAGDLPMLRPEVGASGTLGFAWVVMPALPLRFTYRVNVPAGETGAKAIAGEALYRLSGEELTTGTITTPLNPQEPPKQFYVDDAADAAAADGSSEAPFTTLAQAVEATRDNRGDTIHVRPGVYEEAVALKAKTVLQGDEGAYRTRLPGAEGAEAVVTMADGSTVRGLTIGRDGAAVAVAVPASAEVAVTNCVLTGADVGLQAGAEAEVAFVNNTVHAIAATGLAADPEASVASLRNNIFTRNAAALAVAAEDVQDRGYNLFFDNGTEDAAGPDDLTGDPLFVDEASLNLHLRADSPARDAGDPDPIFTDPDGSACDLGADGGPGGARDDLAPQAVVEASPFEGTAPLTVEFSGAGSTDEWGIAAYAWDFDASDGAAVDSTDKASAHTYATPGVYVATLTVTDHSGLAATATVEIRVGNDLPVVTASAEPAAGPAPHAVTFTAEATDPDGGDVTLAWDFDGDGNPDSDGATAVHTFPKGTAPGAYAVLLTATDDEGASVQRRVAVTVTQGAVAAAETLAEAGGTVAATEGPLAGVSVAVPAEALSAPAVVALAAAPDSLALPRQALGPVVELAPAGLQFGRPVTLTVPCKGRGGAANPLVIAVYDPVRKVWDLANVANVRRVAVDGGDALAFETGGAGIFAVLPPVLNGDTNKDGILNAFDIQAIINAALGRGGDKTVADISGDSRVDAMDIQIIINRVLGKQ